MNVVDFKIFRKFQICEKKIVVVGHGQIRWRIAVKTSKGSNTFPLTGKIITATDQQSETCTLRCGDSASFMISACIGFQVHHNYIAIHNTLHYAISYTYIHIYIYCTYFLLSILYLAEENMIQPIHNTDVQCTTSLKSSLKTI